MDYKEEIIKRLEKAVPDPQDGHEFYVSESRASGSHLSTDVDVTFKLDQRPVKDGVSIEYVSTEDLIDSWKATINDFRFARAVERHRAKIRKSKRDLSRTVSEAVKLGGRGSHKTMVRQNSCRYPLPEAVRGLVGPITYSSEYRWEPTRMPHINMRCTVPPYLKSLKEPEKMSTKKEEVTIKNLPAAPEGWEYTGEFGIAGKGEYIARWRMVNAAGEAAGLEITRPPSGDSTGFIVRKKIKEIDMQAVIDCGLDLEFSTLQLRAPWVLMDRKELSFMGVACEGDSYRFNGLGMSFSACRIRQNHRFAFGGTTSPVPDGLAVRAGGIGYATEGPAQYVEWPPASSFEVIGVADGYKYPWQP